MIKIVLNLISLIKDVNYQTKSNQIKPNQTKSNQIKMRRRLSFGSSREMDAELVQSSSDDQLYRGKRRQSVYSGSTVKSVTSEIKTSEIKTSEGKPIIRRKMIEFEGDGPLGIVFTTNDELLSIKSIMKGSVASEYYDLEIGMNVIQINDISCRGLGYVQAMECLGKLWRTKSSVTLHFEYENPNDLINNPVHSSVYKFLKEISCEEFYGDFDELGVKSLEDFNFIENDDLVKMNMAVVKRRNFLSCISCKLSKSTMTLSFPESMSEKDKTEELERLRILHSDKYIIEELPIISNDV